MPIREIIRLLNLPCRDITALISRSMDENLPPSRRCAVKMHLCYCRACRRFSRQAQILRKAARVAGEAFHNVADADAVKLSPEARERLKRAIES